MYNNNFYKRERPTWEEEDQQEPDDDCYYSSDGDSYFTTFPSPKRTKLTPTITEQYYHSRTLRKFTINIDTRTTITTTLTSHPGRARDWLYNVLHIYRRFRRRLIVGLGVQWVPPSLKAATLQLCIGRFCLIFSLHHSLSSPNILRRFLTDPSVTFVGLWNSTDDKKLWNSDHHLAMQPGMPIDVRHELHDGLRTASIQKIAERRIGVDIDWDHDVSMSDWDDDVEGFRLAQVKQASLDAYVAFLIGMQVQAWELNTQ